MIWSENVSTGFHLICWVITFSTRSELLTANCKSTCGNYIFLSSLQWFLALPCQWWLLHRAGSGETDDGGTVCIHKGKTSTKVNTRDGLPSFKLNNQNCPSSTIAYERSQLFLLMGSLAIYRKATLKILLERYCCLQSVRGCCNW